MGTCEGIIMDIDVLRVRGPKLLNFHPTDLRKAEGGHNVPAHDSIWRCRDRGLGINDYSLDPD